MNKTRLFKKSLLAVTITTATLASQQALAAGFQLNSQSATGLGRAFAGDAVIADNASVMSRNAAAMTLFDSHQFSGGVNIIDTDIKVSDIKYKTGNIDSVTNSSSSPVPNIYYIHKLNEDLAIGAGIYSNFGTKNNFPTSFGVGTGSAGAGLPDASLFGGITEIETINYTLNVAYRINEQWSLGGGIDVVQGSGKLKRDAYSGVNALNIDADGVGVGFNLGTVFELDSNNRFGLAYHYSPEVKASGTVYVDAGIATGNNALIGQNAVAGQDVILPLPSMLEFSGYHRIEDTKFAVHYSLQWIGWDVFEKLETSNNTTIKNYKWQDGYHLSLGGTYYLDDSWTLRAGYMHDTAAQDQLTSISVPDSDRNWLSVGASYAFNNHHTVDFGFTYLMGKDVQVTEYAGTTPVLTATTHANAMLYGLQYSYSF
ncbi:outer membrane protein transport protein [Vibrio sinaloensis]|uniref:outer membrane protein transport protein n=1 Tax=Photobacterium sp. (strain ATCC 43367) TaxID=379097 RepID=UPI002066E03A|nr:outer membrane protein transport protein [Vibrio sinaloensis]UPQ87187.1 OmpP1/FadL family transporter [Vibrio sinaloensis]